MRIYSRLVSGLSIIVISALLLLLSACSSVPIAVGSQGSPTAGTGGSPGKVSTPTPAPNQTIPMPATQTDCPAANTARAAVIRPMAGGKDQNLVYIYNDVPENTSTATGMLRLYDATTGKKSDLVSSGIQILQAQVSNDGQWVLFLSQPDPRGGASVVMLQLVRMDGQGLQTLLCAPYTGSGGGPLGTPAINFQWSVDQKSILFSVDVMDPATQKTTSTISLLNVSTGAIKPLFVDQADDLYAYSVVTWLDNTRAYIVKQGLQGPTPPETLFLIDTATATVAHSNLVTILTSPTRFSDNSFDSSFDGTQLYSSYCLEAASPFNTTIQVGPAQGGTRQTIYQQQPSNCVQVLRVVKPDTLLLLVVVSSGTGKGSTQVWTMNPTSKALHTLTTLTSALPGASQQSYGLNQSSQYPWSNLSRDGGTYALQEIDASAKTQSIVVAPLSGGNPTTVATTNPGNSSVSLVGWTTI